MVAMAAVLVACAPMASDPVAAPATPATVGALTCPAAPRPMCEPARADPDAADLATRRVLAYAERVRPMTAADLGKELNRIGDPAGNPGGTLELVVVLGHTRNPADTGRALGLLDAVLRSNAPDAAPWQPIARLLSARFAEQRRVEEQIDRQNNQLRDSQRRIDQLNSQLEALKQIERSLNSRPPPPPPAPPPATKAP